MMDFPPKASRKRLPLLLATGQPVASHSLSYKVFFVSYWQYLGIHPHRSSSGDTGSESTAPRSLGPPEGGDYKVLGLANERHHYCCC